MILPQHGAESTVTRGRRARCSCLSSALHGALRSRALGLGAAFRALLPERGAGPAPTCRPPRPTAARGKCPFSSTAFVSSLALGLCFESWVCLKMKCFDFLLLGFRHSFPQLTTQLTLSFSFWQTHSVTCEKDICISFMLGM